MRLDRGLHCGFALVYGLVGGLGSLASSLGRREEEIPPVRQPSIAMALRTSATSFTPELRANEERLRAETATLVAQKKELTASCSGRDRAKA